jgi:hypothetical protein
MVTLSLVASSPLCDSMLVEIKWINVCHNTTVFSICLKNNYTFRPFSGWAIIWLRLEHRGKLIHYNVDNKHGEQDLVLQCLGRGCSYIYIWDVDSAMFTTLFVASSVTSSTRGLGSSLNVALESVGRSVLGWVGFISDCPPRKGPKHVVIFSTN